VIFSEGVSELTVPFGNVISSQLRGEIQLIWLVVGDTLSRLGKPPELVHEAVDSVSLSSQHRIQNIYLKAPLFTLKIRRD